MRVEIFRQGKRVLAALLVWSMVLSLAPVNIWANAAADELVGAVTITVVDDQGQPISGAAVNVSVDSDSLGEAYITDIKQTDASGTIEVMPASDFVADDMWLSAEVTAEGYEQGNLEQTQITAPDQDFQVTLARQADPDVIINEQELTYNGQAQELVQVTMPEGSTVVYEPVGNTSYELNDEGQPVAVDAGTYVIKVTVQREGENDVVETVTSVITPANIDGISIEGRTLAYNEEERELVTLTGNFQEGDVVTWIVNGMETGSQEIPKAMAVGTYTVQLRVNRGPNYHVLETVEVTTNLVGDQLGLEGLTITGLNGVYTVDQDGTPVAQPALNVENTGDYTLMYQLDGGDLAVNETAWVSDIPTVTDAKSYVVWVKAVKASDGTETPVDQVVAAYNVYMAQAEQILEFNNYDNDSDTITLSGAVPYVDVTYDFSATDITALAGGTITYQVECDEGVAAIDENGILTVYYPGDITVIATLSGNENYNACVIKYYLSVIGEVANQGDYIFFPESEQNYVFGTSKSILGQDIIASQSAELVDESIKGEITYKLEGPVKGVNIEEDDGTVSVSDYDALADAIRDNGGTLEIQVTATKAQEPWYSEDSATYTVHISFEQTPDELYTIDGVKGKDNWYKLVPVTVHPPEGYKIAKKASEEFQKTVEFNDQGSTKSHVYLENIETGGITDWIPIEIKIDSEPPHIDNMSIEIGSTSTMDQSGPKFEFFNPSVTIKFTVADEVGDDESGLDYLEWYYAEYDGAAAALFGEPEGELKAEEEVTDEGKKYVATLTLTANELKQYRGHIAFKAYDKAGNESALVKEEGIVVVVDTINPVMNASFQAADKDGFYNPVIQDGVVRHYFAGDVDFTFTVKETNFFPEDVEIAVTKDNESHAVDVAWTTDEANEEIHYGTFTLSDDGDYVVTMRYKDRSNNGMVDGNGNEVELYTSEMITIDTSIPVVGFEFQRDQDSESGEDVQKTIFTVKDRNFSPQNIEVTGTMGDVNGDLAWAAEELTEILHNGQWVQEEGEADTYKFEYDGYVDGIYELTLDYQSYSGWSAEPFTDDFIIDHTPPTQVQISYEESALEKFLEAITFGFYKASVTVKFTAVDDVAGVESFTWSYTREEGASETNQPDRVETITEIKQDPNDKSKYTGTMTLTSEENEQYRGYIGVFATDAYGNSSDEKVDDENLIVLDTVAPQLTVEYLKENGEVWNTDYYNGAVVVKLTVTEANFYPEDVELSVTKDGKAFDYGAVEWGDRDKQDNTVGMLILPAPKDHSGDGAYEIKVNYTDRSENEPIHYQSNVITIDTKAPEVKVEYQNRSPVNTLKDGAGHDRQYFVNTQTAVVTITERNFNPADVNYHILAQDVAGNFLDLAGLVSMSAWKSQGDVHTMTITYPGDANYTFDVDYTDLASNEAADYSPDYFTVDQTAPTNLRVTYSTSILDTILEKVSFGFYNAKMTVTISADDTVSGVHAFEYSYLNAQGVSSVNAQLLNQVISAADIRYSQDGVTASASFDIPKMLLGRDNQFNGVVEFTATNRSGTESVLHREAKRIVVDNISPTAQVRYNAPVNTQGDVAYYDGSIRGTISIREANFYPQDVRVTVSKDGGEAVTLPTSWSDESVDDHVGTFTLQEDGDYIVTIQYRDKSSNQMETYTSQQMTIDTQLEDPTFSVNGQSVGEDGGSYKGETEVAFAFEDINLGTQSVRLVRVRHQGVEEVTDRFIQLSNTETGGAGSFSIPAEAENDGIYTLTVEVTDKAMHTVQAQMKFTINRFGSVYVYDDALMALIKDGGQYVTIQNGENAAITEDLVITEYNANPLLDGSQRLLITRDGESVEPDYTMQSAVTDEAAETDQAGWYQYVYVIDPSNFAEDGVYKISLSSGYVTTDSEENISTSVPENSMDGSGTQVTDAMTFTVDTTAPEIRNIVNLEQEIINASTVDVKYTVVDVGGLRSVEVLVDGQSVDSVSQFDGDGLQYNGEFTIYESGKTQNIRLKVTDLAGNVTDTAAEDFNANALFEFHDKVTVSTNFFVRWYANKLVFWSTVGGAVLILGVLVFVLVAVRRKREAYQ